VDLTTAAVFHEPALATYQRFATLDRTAYAYCFARVSPGNQRSGMLAYHMAELPYLFGPITPGDEYDPVDASISDAMQHAWTEFARTGTPRAPDGTPWPPCRTTASQLTVIENAVRFRLLHPTPLTKLIHSARADNATG
jgi:para-nitrobenzyl esterase